MAQARAIARRVAAVFGRDPAMLAVWLVAAIYAGFVLFFIVMAVAVDQARPPAQAGAESVPVGLDGEYLVDFGTIDDPEKLFLDEVAGRFRPAGGQMPVSGMQYFRDGAMWLRFRVPEIASPDAQRTVRLSDPRVRWARLVYRKDGETTVRDWRFDDAERRAGLGTRTPAFHFGAQEIAGLEMHLGFLSLSVLRGSVHVESRRAFEAWDMRRTVLPSIFAGALVAIGIYLVVTGLLLRDVSLVAAGVMAFLLMTVLFGGPGLFHVFVLPASPSLADVAAYLLKPLVLSIWLVFLISYLRLRRRAPVVTRVLLAIALAVPFQAVLAAFKIGFGLQTPIVVTSSVPMLAGLLCGAGVLVRFALAGDRRARLFLLCWTPLILGTTARTLVIMFPTPRTAQLLAEDTFADIVVCMIALAIAMVSEIQARERKLRQTAAEQTRLAAMGQVAGGIAHEVNNLLHPIVNLARRVRDRRVDEPERLLLLDMVIESGRRAGEVVEGVLDAVGPARRRGPLVPVGVAVERAAATAIASLPPGFSISTRIEPVDGPRVAVGEMLQVIGNLLRNAEQAAGPDGRVTIALEPEEGAAARLTIEDNGGGMTEDIRSRALTPFVTSREDGTGLGLAAVAALVSVWHGTIDIRSAPGQGTTVVIVIPKETA